MDKTQKRAIIDTHELMRREKIQKMTSRVTKNDQAGLKSSPRFGNVAVSSSEGIVYWAQSSLRSLSLPLTRKVQFSETPTAKLRISENVIGRMKK